MKAIKAYKYYKILGEYSTSGTRSITIENAGYYNLEMVGAGGGGAHNAYNKYWRAGTGGSGAGFIGEVYLTAGTYTVAVGSGGSEKYDYPSHNYSQSTNGGDTVFSINNTSLITCGGGTGGDVAASTITIGTGGTLSINSSTITRNIKLNKNGNNGNSSNNYGSYLATNGGLSVYDNTITGYGAGGSTITALQASPDAVSGYFKLYREVESTDDYDYILEEYKVQQEVVRTYYKYSYVDWTQPTLTSDTTSTSLGNIVVTCSSYATHDNYHPYLAMNNNWGGGSGGCWASNYVTSAWWKVVFPYNIKITNIDFQGRQTSESKIYTSEGGALLGTVSSTTRTNIPVDNVVTNTLYVTVQGNSTVGIIEMRLTATRISGSQESTEEDYDYYIDITKCRAFKF